MPHLTLHIVVALNSASSNIIAASVVPPSMVHTIAQRSSELTIEYSDTTFTLQQIVT